MYPKVVFSQNRLICRWMLPSVQRFFQGGPRGKTLLCGAGSSFHSTALMHTLKLVLFFYKKNIWLIQVQRWRSIDHLAEICCPVWFCSLPKWSTSPFLCRTLRHSITTMTERTEVGRDWIARTSIFIILILTIRVVSAYLKLRQGRKRPCCSQRIAKFRGWNRTCCASVPFWWWKKGERERSIFYINYLASSFFLSLHTYNLVPRGRQGLLTSRVTVLTTQLWGFACMY